MSKQRDITRELFKHHKISFDSPAFVSFWDKCYSVVAIEDETQDATFINPDNDKETSKRIKAEKVWGCGLALNGNPIYSTFIWGFVGDDYTGSGYDSEIIAVLEAIGKGEVVL